MDRSWRELVIWCAFAADTPADLPFLSSIADFLQVEPFPN
jgi:hypothetical protein